MQSHFKTNRAFAVALLSVFVLVLFDWHEHAVSAVMPDWYGGIGQYALLGFGFVSLAFDRDNEATPSWLRAVATILAWLFPAWIFGLLAAADVDLVALPAGILHAIAALTVLMPAVFLVVWALSFLDKPGQKEHGAQEGFRRV